MVRAQKLLLVLAASPAEDPVLADLESRGFELSRAATPEAAEATLRDHPVALVLVCPDAAAGSVDRLAAAVERTRKGVPVLAIRQRSAGAPETHASGVGVLRQPLLPDALVRSVEVVLGLKRK